MLKYNGVLYSYIRNLQGDIVGIVDASGNLVVEYKYDAWGRKVSISGSLSGGLGALNLFRYRGYIYDEETNLYYVSNRYLIPEIGRFLLPDSCNNLGLNTDFSTLNLYTYCGNNSVAHQDQNGNCWFIAFAIGIATQYAADIVGNIMDGKTGSDIWRTTSSVGDYLAAGVTALIPGTGLGAAIVRNVVSEGISIVEDRIEGEEVNISDSLISIGIGAALDVGFEKIADKTLEIIDSKSPKNYSSYAHAVRQSNPDATREQIQDSLVRSIKRNHAQSKAISFGIDVTRSCLPY